ncbi:succinate dehydrogenase cytochrome b subunit [Gaoshiqia sp. Z1-71]|uniref:succinate dehydrogenase cytochrome b subunit n=1 Tax=Gaoshiqia hydrogeniformans TaxID=3290090 RepID=UPI003BF890B3
MSNFLTASIGRKFIMSISGLFLIMFICVHLGINLLLIFDDSGRLFNLGANFMATNPLIKVMEPLLGLGFIVHIIWSFIISYQNYKARPVGYAQSNASYSSSWASRNMLILGALVLVFLVIHVMNFFYVIKFDPHSLDAVVIDGVEMHDSYTLVAGLFKSSVVYCIVYVIGGVLLGLHLGHGFWSSFQTIGLTNKHWLTRLQLVGKIYAIVVTVGFSIIPLYFLIKF